MSTGLAEPDLRAPERTGAETDLPAPGPRPSAARRRPRTRLETAGLALTGVGLGTVLFALYAFVYSDLVNARHQSLLWDELRSVLASGRGGSAPVQAGDDSGLLGSAATARTERETVKPTPPGTPVALLRIPRLGLREVVVEGTTAAELRRGPGHYRGTPLPGEPGNAAIAARRATFGGPFADLDRLRRGDRIEVVTQGGRFTYLVDRPARRVRSGDPDPLVNTPTDHLTLVTSTPRGLATEGLVVRARLRGLPVVPAPGRVLGTPSRAESGFDAAPGAAYAMVFWGGLLAAAAVGAALLYRRWLRWPTWLLTTPVLLALTLRFFQSVTDLFPATW